MEEKNAIIVKLTSRVQFLEKKVNDIERYSSKASIVLNNLTLVQGNDYWEDVFLFLQGTEY